MSAPLRIEPAGAPDLDALAALAALAGGWSRVDLAAELERPVAEVLVARAGGVVRGFVLQWVVAGEASILVVAVDPAARRLGVGRRLIRAAERRAEAGGATVAHLEVRRRNAVARAFYAALGYREAGVRPGYYADDGDDAVLLSRVLGGGVDLAILAGGRGERMGGALKALLVRPDGLTILDALARTLGPRVRETWLVAPGPRLAALDPGGRLEGVADAGAGPAEALRAAAAVSRARWLLAVGADQPRPTARLLDRLLAVLGPGEAGDLPGPASAERGGSAPGAQPLAGQSSAAEPPAAVAVRLGGVVQPLWALYRREALLGSPAPHSLSGWLRSAPTRVVEEGELSPEELDALRDADTPADAEALGLG